MSFGLIAFTNQGRALQAKAQAGAQLNFTKIAVGDGQLSGQAIADLTNLIHEVKSITLNKFKTMPGGKAVIGGVLSNQDIAAGFWWRELGLFAQDPDLGEILYCYGNAGDLAEYIPSPGGSEILEKQINIVTIVGNASNVSATIGQSLVYATKEDIDDLQQQINNIDVTGTQITVDQTQAPTSPGNGTLAQLFSWLANRIKAITGKSNWWEAPDTTLANAKSHIDDTVIHITASERSAWNAKQNAISGAASSITNSNLTASRALVSDANGKVAVSGVTSTELGYLSGVTSNIQTQLNAKLNSSAYTAADVLAKIKTVDGAGSGLDADTVDGKHASDFQVSATSRVSGIVTYTDSIAGGSTLTKTIALGGSYKQGRVIFSNKLIVEVTTDSSKSFMLGSTRYYVDSSKYYHLPEFYTRQQLGSITKVNDWSDTARGFGAFAVGVTPEETRYVQVQECYINGTNLTIIFSNSSSSAISMNLSIYWEVW